MAGARGGTGVGGERAAAETPGHTPCRNDGEAITLRLNDSLSVDYRRAGCLAGVGARFHRCRAWPDDRRESAHTFARNRRYRDVGNSPVAQPTPNGSAPGRGAGVAAIPRGAYLPTISHGKASLLCP